MFLLPSTDLSLFLKRYFIPRDPTQASLRRNLDFREDVLREIQNLIHILGDNMDIPEIFSDFMGSSEISVEDNVDLLRNTLRFLRKTILLGFNTRLLGALGFRWQ